MPTCLFIYIFQGLFIFLFIYLYLSGIFLVLVVQPLCLFLERQCKLEWRVILRLPSMVPHSQAHTHIPYTPRTPPNPHTPWLAYTHYNNHFKDGHKSSILLCAAFDSGFVFDFDGGPLILPYKGTSPGGSRCYGTAGDGIGWIYLVELE